MSSPRRARREGFTLVELLIVLLVIAILATMAIPNLLSSRKAANETLAIHHLRTICTAQEVYKTRKLGEGESYATLARMEEEKLVPWPRRGVFVIHDYTFADIAAPTASEWGVSAVPNDRAGDRSFCVTTEKAIREHPGTAAPASLEAARGEDWKPLR